MAAMTTYFLPHACGHLLHGAESFGITFTEQTLTYQYMPELIVPGFCITGEAEALSRFQEVRELVDQGAVLLPNDTLAHAWVPSTSVEVHTVKDQVVVEHIIPRLEEIEHDLRDFSNKTGKNVTLHVLDGVVRQPPFPSKPQSITVILGAGPPGDFKDIWRDRICGVRVDKAGYHIRSHGPARGYGVVVCDSDDNVVAQIVGTTFYLLLPLSKSYLYGKEGGNIFLKSLALAWNTFAQGKTPPEEIPLEEASYAEALEKAEGLFRKYTEEMMVEDEKKLQELEKEYRDLLLKRSTGRQMLRGLELGQEDPDVLRQKRIREWEKLNSLPLVDRITSVDDGFHIYTKDIIVHYEGARYDLGRYAIRINEAGEISVWSLSNRHPKGVPHPHISRRGAECFGNISLEIQRLLSERRVVDVVELVLKWLSEGYDAKIAETPVTEWPTLLEMEAA